MDTWIFTARGYVWPMETLDREYFTPNSLEGSDNFASVCVRVQFQFH